MKISSPKAHAPLTAADLQHARHYATQKHRGKHRHGVHPTMKTPYITHAIEVSTRLKRHGATIPEQIAGMLHGIPKNVPVLGRPRTRESEATQLKNIEHQFGKDVRTMVAGITDLPTHAAPWLARKCHYIAQIENTESLLPPAQKSLRDSILKLSMADEQACMASLIKNIERAKQHKLNPNAVFAPFKTDGLPPKEALIWFFNQLSQTYHYRVNTFDFANDAGKGLLEVYDETLRKLTQLTHPSRFKHLAVAVKAYFTTPPNNPPLY